MAKCHLRTRKGGLRACMSPFLHIQTSLPYVREGGEVKGGKNFIWVSTSIFAIRAIQVDSVLAPATKQHFMRRAAADDPCRVLAHRHELRCGKRKRKKACNGGTPRVHCLSAPQFIGRGGRTAQVRGYISKTKFHADGHLLTSRENISKLASTPRSMCAAMQGGHSAD